MLTRDSSVLVSFDTLDDIQRTRHETSAPLISFRSRRFIETTCIFVRSNRQLFCLPSGRRYENEARGRLIHCRK